MGQAGTGKGTVRPLFVDCDLEHVVTCAVRYISHASTSQGFPMARAKYSITHDGHTFTRRTTRTYTHLVLEKIEIASYRAECLQKGWKPRDQFEYPSADGSSFYVIIGWAGRPDLAAKLANGKRSFRECGASAPVVLPLIQPAAA